MIISATEATAIAATSTPVTADVVIARHTFLGDPETRFAPNGSTVSAGEQVAHHVEIVAWTDTDGKRRLEARGHKAIRRNGYDGPGFGAWSDGSEERISRWLVKINIAEAEARKTQAN